MEGRDQGIHCYKEMKICAHDVLGLCCGEVRGKAVGLALRARGPLSPLVVHPFV